MKFKPIIVAATALLVLTACSGDEPATEPTTAEASGIAIVASARANQPSYDAVALRALLDDAVAENVTITVTTDDGAPRLFASGTLTDLPKNRGSRAQKMRQFRGEIESAINDSSAVSPEANPLEAIAQAARSIRDVAGERHIVSLSNMLQTTGALPMQGGLLDAEPADVVEQLDEAGSLPDLADYHITLLALGETAPPQDALDEAARRRLEQLWVTILEAAGATVSVGSAGPGASPSQDLPDVTPVPIRTIAVQAGECRFEIPDSQIGFVANSAEFLDETEARAVIESVGRELRGCSGEVTVYGYTSSAGTPEGRERTATDRAMAVAKLVAEMSGWDVNDFTVDGRGYAVGDGQCVVDRNAVGELDLVLAAQNRKVVVSVA